MCKELLLVFIGGVIGILGSIVHEEYRRRRRPKIEISFWKKPRIFQSETGVYFDINLEIKGNPNSSLSISNLYVSFPDSHAVQLLPESYIQDKDGRVFHRVQHCSPGPPQLHPEIPAGMTRFYDYQVHFKEVKDFEYLRQLVDQEKYKVIVDILGHKFEVEKYSCRRI